MALTCICGHQSPDDARFCANCGRPLQVAADETAAAKQVPAAPQGAVDEEAILARSEKGFLDKVWDFFASVPVATVLLFVLAAVSVIGTMIDQEGQYASWMPPVQYYPTRYGAFWGDLILKTGLSHAYSTWWFLVLLGMVGVSLTVCSIQRGVPLYRAIHRPNVSPAPGFLKHMQHRFTYSAAEGLDRLAEVLRSQRYSVIIKGKRLFAEKGRWGRWGPYVVHLGLIVLLLGAMSRWIPGWYSESYIWVPDGETVQVPGTTWAVRSDKFTADFYEDGRPKLYQTEASIMDGAGVAKQQKILLNQPLSYKGVELYQSSYKTRLQDLKVQLQTKADSKAVGDFSINLSAPATSYKVGDVEVQIVDYYPDFALDENNKPISQSGDPNQPAFQISYKTADGKVQGPMWFFPTFPDAQDVHSTGEINYKLAVTGMTQANETGLRVKHDRGIWVVYGGLAVTLLGLALRFYLSHRRIWAMADGASVLVAGQTDRNKFTFGKEFRRLATALDAGSVTTPQFNQSVR